MSFSRDRRNRRLLEFRWDVWTAASHSSRENILILWRSVRVHLEATLNSLLAYLFTFSLEAHRTSSTSAMYDESFVFWHCTSISRTWLSRSYEDSLVNRSLLFESERWLRSRVASFFWTFWEHSWWASWWFDKWFVRWWWFFRFRLTRISLECEFHFGSLRWASWDSSSRRRVNLEFELLVFI